MLWLPAPVYYRHHVKRVLSLPASAGLIPPMPSAAAVAHMPMPVLAVDALLSLTPANIVWLASAATSRCLDRCVPAETLLAAMGAHSAIAAGNAAALAHPNVDVLRQTPVWSRERHEPYLRLLYPDHFQAVAEALTERLVTVFHAYRAWRFQQQPGRALQMHRLGSGERGRLLIGGGKGKGKGKSLRMRHRRPMTSCDVMCSVMPYSPSCAACPPKACNECPPTVCNECPPKPCNECPPKLCNECPPPKCADLIHIKPAASCSACPPSTAAAPADLTCARSSSLPASATGCSQAATESSSSCSSTATTSASAGTAAASDCSECEAIRAPGCVGCIATQCQRCRSADCAECETSRCGFCVLTHNHGSASDCVECRLTKCPLCNDCRECDATRCAPCDATQCDTCADSITSPASAQKQRPHVDLASSVARAAATSTMADCSDCAATAAAVADCSDCAALVTATTPDRADYMAAEAATAARASDAADSTTTTTTTSATTASHPNRNGATPSSSDTATPTHAFVAPATPRRASASTSGASEYMRSPNARAVLNAHHSLSNTHSAHAYAHGVHSSNSHSHTAHTPAVQPPERSYDFSMQVNLRTNAAKDASVQVAAVKLNVLLTLDAHAGVVNIMFIHQRSQVEDW